MVNKGLITEEEKSAARHCIQYAVSHGAAQARVSLSKSVLDTFLVLNGELDKVTHCADRAIYIHIFADGRYGTFSTNRFGTAELEDFVRKAIAATLLIAKDKFRKLPDRELIEKSPMTGFEMGLYDTDYDGITSEERTESALSGSIYGKTGESDDYELLSEECEYSDSAEDNFMVDSLGFEGRHAETSAAFWSEITIADKDGNKYSGYMWDSSPQFSRINIKDCSLKALSKAVAQIGPVKHRSGKFTMVVDRYSSSRLVAPIFSALNAGAVQQKNSFLADYLGKRAFSEKLSIFDRARSKGEPGARMFDSEGLATSDGFVIENGIIRKFFVSTYMSGKTGLAPTIDGVSRPVLMPFSDCDDAAKFTSDNAADDVSDGAEDIAAAQENCKNKDKQVSLDDLLRYAGSGILVTGFNGGNCNGTTGDFSYGIEGFAFEKGIITHPVKEMVVTGNMLTLWNSICAAGTDAVFATRWQIPSLVFKDVDFSA